MKLSVRARVANGVVICLLLPRVADTAIGALEIKEGLASFSADDDFAVVGRSGKFAAASVDLPSASTDPSGGDPSGCDPSGTLRVTAPAPLVTTEEGRTDHFVVSMNPNAVATQYYYFDPSGGDPSGCDPSGGYREAAVIPNAVAFEPGTCAARTIWVVGQNDGRADCDGTYDIRIRDQFGTVVRDVPGVNVDNDNYSSVSLDVLGPQEMLEGQDGTFTVTVTNLSVSELSGNRLEVEATSGLAILSYAASLMSGAIFDSPGLLTPQVLRFDNVELQSEDVLILSLGVQLTMGSPGGERITARFSRTDQRSDDDFVVHMVPPE